MIGLLITGCSLFSIRFTAQPDESDVLNYTFGGGELGADLTQLVIRDDGHVSYRYLLPFEDSWPQDEINRDYQLSAPETEALFQSLVDAGLFDLSYAESEGVDIPRTLITASVDGHMLEAAMDGVPDAAIHGKIEDLVATIHPER